MVRITRSLVALSVLAVVGPLPFAGAAQAAAPVPAGVSCADGTLAPLVGVTHYADGGAAYHYKIGAEIHTVPIAPAGFDPTGASAADLDRYGLPPRPAATDAAAQAGWQAMATAWRRNTDASLCVGTQRKYHTFQAAGGSAPALVAAATANQGPTYSVISGNWAGYIADAGAGSTTYIAVQGDFVQPTYHTSCTPSEEGSWTGLGGYHSARLIQTGTEMSTNRAWYEYLGANGAGVNPIYTINVGSGHRIHTYVVIQRSTGQTTFYVYDSVTGVNKSVVLTLPVSIYYDGSTTEYIDELPDPDYNYLRNFSAIAWTNAQAQKTSGTWYTLQSQTHTESILQFAGTTLAHPGAMTGSETFTEHYYHC